MRFLLRFATLVSLTLGLVAAAFAQRTQPPTFADPYYAQVAPLRGAYYDTSQSGQGISVDIGPDGTMLVGVFHHDQNGAPSFHTMQGRFEPAYAYPQGPVTQPNRPNPGALGTLRSPLYLTTGGNCLDCPHRASSTVPDTSLGMAELSFTESRRATLRIGSRTLNLRHMEFDRTVENLIPGRWLFAVWEGAQTADALAAIEIAPMPYEPVFQAIPCCNTGPEFPVPSAAAKLFRVSCVERCASFDAWRSRDGSPQQGDAATAEILIWYEPATGKAVLDQFIRTNSGVLTASIWRRFHELSIDTTLITGRASYRGAYVWINTNEARPIEGALVQMTRLPDGKRIF